jgi:hypothetical protein
MFKEKRFYTRGTLRSIRISRLAKIPTLYRDWLRSLKKEKGQLFELHRKDDKVIHCSAQNAALFVDIF